MSAIQILLSETIAAAGGGGNIALRAVAHASGSAGTLTITKPAGVVSGDVMYCVILQDTNSATLTGWTQIGSTTSGSNSFPCQVLRKVAGGSEGANYAFTNAGSTNQGSIIALSGVNATPEDATTTTARGTAASVAYPSITTANANSWHLALACNSGGLLGTPASYTLQDQSAVYCNVFSRLIAAAGAVSGVTSTGGNDWAAFSVAVRSS